MDGLGTESRWNCALRLVLISKQVMMVEILPPVEQESKTNREKKVGEAFGGRTTFFVEIRLGP